MDGPRRRPPRTTRRQAERDDAVPRKAPGVAASPVPPGAGDGPGLGVPPSPGAGPFPDSGVPRDAAYALQSPASFQPPGASTVRLQGRRSAQVLADGEVELATTQLLQGSLGVIRIINVGVNNLLGSSNIVFRIKVAGSTVDGWQWSPFAQPVAVFQQEFPPESTLIEVPEAAKISLTASVLDAGTYDLDMMVQGWQYGRKLMDDYLRAWRAGVR